MTHTLKIHSLHDVDATCSCGKWSIMFTGKGTREFVQAEFDKHLAYVKKYHKPLGQSDKPSHYATILP